MHSFLEADVHGDEVVTEKKGTGADQHDMARMGKTQETRVCPPRSFIRPKTTLTSYTAQLPVPDNLRIHSSTHGVCIPLGPVRGVLDSRVACLLPGDKSVDPAERFGQDRIAFIQP